MINYGLDLAVIGNGRAVALVDPSSRLVWWCFPRFDADPVFSRLLAGDEEKGFSDVVLDSLADIRSDYARNTAMVSTTLTDRCGNAVRITIRVRPTYAYGKPLRQRTLGSNHIRYFQDGCCDSPHHRCTTRTN